MDSVAFYESVCKEKVEKKEISCYFVSELKDNQFRKCYQIVEMSVIVKYKWISILRCVISYNVGEFSVEQKIAMELRIKARQGEKL